MPVAVAGSIGGRCARTRDGCVRTVALVMGQRPGPHVAPATASASGVCHGRAGRGPGRWVSDVMNKYTVWTHGGASAHDAPMTLRRVSPAIAWAAAGSAAALLLGWIGATGRHASVVAPLEFSAIAIAYFAAGGVAWRRRPENHTGRLMMGVGAGIIVAMARNVPLDIVTVLARMQLGLNEVILAYLLLAYPVGRLGPGLERAVVRVIVAVYVVVAALQLVTVDTSSDPYCLGCPPNPFRIVATPGGVTTALVLLTSGVLGTVVVLLLVRRWLLSLPPSPPPPPPAPAAPPSRSSFSFAVAPCLGRGGPLPGGPGGPARRSPIWSWSSAARRAASRWKRRSGLLFATRPCRSPCGRIPRAPISIVMGEPWPSPSRSRTAR